MEKKEYLLKVRQAEIDSEKVEKVTKLYGAEMPDIIQRIVSYGQEAVFFDDGVRVLAYEEIIDAECGENDFIVYHFNDNIWSKFNIVDESVFKKKKSIEELLK